MKTVTHCIIYAILLITIHEAAGRQIRSEYYANIPFWESPVQPFKGAVPLTKEQALERIHLRLDYDSQNRVVQANVAIGEHLKAFQGYSKLYIDAPLTKVSYDQNTETHRFFDHYEQPTTIMEGVFSKVYEKDALGRNISLVFLDEDGDPATDYFGYARYEWTYEFDGAIIEERFDKEGTPGPLRGGFHFLRTRMIYGPDGYPHILQNIDNDGALVNSESGAAIFKYYYDRQGRFDRWEVYDKNGHPAIGPSGTAGEQNVHESYYLQAIEFFDRDGAPAVHWSGAEKWVMEYDQYGNTTTRAFQTSKGAPMNGYSGYSARVYEWSEDGRWLLAQLYLDANGNPVNAPDGISKTEYHRDDKGVIIDTLQYEYRDGKYLLK